MVDTNSFQFEYFIWSIMLHTIDWKRRQSFDGKFVLTMCSLAVTIWITPSSPRIAEITRPRVHRIGGRLSLQIVMIVPIWMFQALPLCHFSHTVSSWRYFLFQRIQKWYFISGTCCQDDSQPDGMLNKLCSGKLVIESPIRKWPGVKAVKSLRSKETDLSCEGCKLLIC